MRKQWKQLMVICFAAVMVVTMPGASLLADEMPTEEIIVTEAEDPEETMDYYESSGEDKTIDGNELLEEYDDGHISAEEVVGVGEVQVGDGVTATFNSTTGAVEFYSNGGTLWRDWIEKIGPYNRGYITSVKVVSGTVYLPEDSSEIFALGENYGRGISTKLEALDLRGFNTSRVKNMEIMFGNCSKLTELDLSNFNTSKVTNLRGIFLNCKSLTRLNLRSFDTSRVTDMEMMFQGCESRLEKFEVRAQRNGA